ncbi:hypothetical protein [Streptomyces sp. NPDC048172]|uniref:hypothetical protein n=1 Tax=Streptomyces sp. NPDC048172 TaxID=3365505 RepID=UPI00371721B7
MKSWRSRIAVGLAVGAAAIAMPLTAASSASAAPAPAPTKAESVHAAGWKKVGGWKKLESCKHEGRTWPGAKNYMCWPVDASDSSKGYNLWVEL